MLEINQSDVVAEVTACCEAYEQALVANDVAALQAFFWDSDHAVRFGVGEQLYGGDAISAFRARRVVNFSDRSVRRLTVLALGRDVASAMLEFQATVAGVPRLGRQSQVWARIPGAGWRVVAGHVSHQQHASGDFWSGYVDHAAAAIEMPVDPAHRAGVASNLQRTAALAGLLFEFELPDSVDAAPVFTP